MLILLSIDESKGQSSATSAVFESNEHVIEEAKTFYNMFYEKWTMESAAEEFGAYNIPKDLLQAIKLHWQVVEVSFGDCKKPAFFSKELSPTELEIACSAMCAGKRWMLLTEQQASDLVDGAYSEDSCVISAVSIAIEQIRLGKQK